MMRIKLADKIAVLECLAKMTRAYYEAHEIVGQHGASLMAEPASPYDFAKANLTSRPKCFMSRPPVKSTNAPSDAAPTSETTAKLVIRFLSQVGSPAARHQE